MQHCFALSVKSLALSRVRDGHRNRKLQKYWASLSRDAACNLDLLIDSMMMSFDALFGSRLQGHECKGRLHSDLSSAPISALLALHT